MEGRQSDSQPKHSECLNPMLDSSLKKGSGVTTSITRSRMVVHLSLLLRVEFHYVKVVIMAQPPSLLSSAQSQLDTVANVPAYLS